MADVLGKKISELAETTDLAGLYTIGSDKNNQSKKVPLQFVKEAADYANAQGDYAKGVGDTVQGNTGVDEYPVFSASTQYAAGSVVRYNDRLYRFTALHPAGSWVGTDAIETSIKAETESKLTELESEVKGFREDIKSSSTTVKSNTQIVIGTSYNITNNASSQVRVRTLDDIGNTLETLGYIPENTTRTIVANSTYTTLEFYCSVGVDVTIKSEKGLVYDIENLRADVQNQLDSQSSLIENNSLGIKEVNLKLDGVAENIKSNSTTYSKQIDLLLNSVYNLANNSSEQVRVRTISQSGDVIENLGYIPANTIRQIKPTLPYWGLDFYCSVGIDVEILSASSVQGDIKDANTKIDILSQEIKGNKKEYQSASTSYKIPYAMYKGIAYVVTNNGNASMSCYSIDENQQETDVFSVTMGADGKRTITPNEDVYGIGGYCSTGVNLIIELAESYNSRIENVESLIDGLPSDDILTLNPKSEYDNLIYNAARSARGTKQLPMLLHFSDLHARLVNFERLQRFRERYAEITSDVIGTGDLVLNLFTEDFSWWNGAFLVAIGNHDVWTTDTSNASILDYQEGGFWVVKQKAAYDKFIAPFVESWNVIQPSNAASIGACYYYKDYDKVRMIVLDSMHYGKGDDISSGQSVQDSWLKGVLSDALTKDKSVVIVSHYWGGAMNEVECSYNDIDKSSTDFISELAPKSVQDFIDNGGDFVCWMCGHSHYDAIGTLVAYPKQLQVVITNANNISASHAQSRNENTKGQDAFNYIAFDSDDKLVKVVRVGADADRLLRMKRRLTYRYADVADLNKGLIICE